MTFKQPDEAILIRSEHHDFTNETTPAVLLSDDHLRHISEHVKQPPSAQRDRHILEHVRIYFEGL